MMQAWCRVRLVAAWVVLTALLALAACGQGENARRSFDKPPFDVTIAESVLHIPDRAELKKLLIFEGGVPMPGRDNVLEVSYLTSMLTLNVCERRDRQPPAELCVDLGAPLVSRNGVRVVVHALVPESRLRLFKERPVGVPSPTHAPLVPILEGLARPSLDSVEWSLLLRLRIGGPTNEGAKTTALGWPVVNCWVLGEAPETIQRCVAGFLIGRLFIEAEWAADAGEILDQAGVWAVTSALDAKVHGVVGASRALTARRCSVPPAHEGLRRGTGCPSEHGERATGSP